MHLVVSPGLEIWSSNNKGIVKRGDENEQKSRTMRNETILPVARSTTYKQRHASSARWLKEHDVIVFISSQLSRQETSRDVRFLNTNKNKVERSIIIIIIANVISACIKKMANFTILQKRY